MPRAKVFSPEEDVSPTHDELAMFAVKHRKQLLFYAFRKGWISMNSATASFHQAIEDRQKHEIMRLLDQSTAEVEVPIGDAFRRRVDVAFFASSESDTPILLLEIKSKRENQSASDWTAQIRGYEEFTDVPCLLVVSHDLSPGIAKYLEFANIKVADVRDLE